MEGMPKDGDLTPKSNCEEGGKEEVLKTWP